MNSLIHPTVSVVIPMYNVGKYIELSINSVLNQTYQDFELICVDDGCSDDTLVKVAQFDDPRIKVISQLNRGLAGARNTGIRAARGEYIALLDADDFWLPEKLEKHVAHLEANSQLGISYCPSLFMDEDDTLLGIGQFPKLTGITSKDVFCRNPIGNGSAPVIRKAVLEAVAFEDGMRNWQQYFDEELRQSEDIELWIRIALDTDYKMEGIEQPLTYYRVNASGLSSNLHKQFTSWQYAVDQNRIGHDAFFNKYGSLAKAYQLRYLCRRAIQSRNSTQAIKLMHNALKTNWRIIKEEPKRTLATLACTYLCTLPNSLYDAIESVAMRGAAFLQKSH
ncbi:glycosyltransferase family 2 protein [Pseudoalteromonas sp. SMS1]|uniref:glycosyltransferase family 2 protein n=1 Tax=Pseudoalteromonas sp. SMS1 TaxID=2908894 RepID=UPI001F1C0889|nr:glycosyltransferase family A protein [Pseudoalteromonas sp. SMS1]MCF2856563.1 glycosyltransferase family 2 protein [Pseudoalteromonas sp. SMS1]